jgi:hypothetical protein
MGRNNPQERESTMLPQAKSISSERSTHFADKLLLDYHATGTDRLARQT